MIFRHIGMLQQFASCGAPFLWVSFSRTCSTCLNPPLLIHEPKIHYIFTAFYHFYSAVALLAMQSAILATAIPSLRLFVTRWYPVQSNEDKIMRSSLWGSKNTLVFWYQHWLGGNVSFHLKFALKVTHCPLKNADFDQYLLITSQP